MRFAVDEDLNNDIIRGLLRVLPNLDIVRSIDVGLSGASDPVGLRWAASEGRIMLSHDASSMERHAWERVGTELPMPGTIILHKNTQMGMLIQELVQFIESGENIENRVIHLPSR